MAESDKMAGDEQARGDLGNVMLVPVDEDENPPVMTEAEARAFMERPIRAQREKENNGG